MRIDIWADIVCPWCYIGKRRFERALAGFPHRDKLEVVNRSFQLNPGAPRETTSDRRAHLMSKYGWSEAKADEINTNLMNAAAGEGLEYHLDGRDIGNTLDAHRIMHLGLARGMQNAVLERLYRAFFTDRQSIFDDDSLVALAAEAGLDTADARRVLQDNTYADAVTADMDEARRRGVTGVPFFLLHNRHRVAGAQVPDVLAAALDCAWQEAQAGAQV